MLFLLAWRNVWRNPFRTWSILVSIAFSMAGVWVFGSVVRGINEQRLQERLNTSLGHAKLTNPSFLNHKPTNAYFIFDSNLEKKIKKQAFITAYSPRLNVYASIKNASDWRAVDVYGIHAQQEVMAIQLYKYIKVGRYLRATDTIAPEVVIGSELAKRTNKKVGDSLLIYFKKPRALCIVGIYEVPSKAFSMTHVFIPYQILQATLQLPERACHQLLLKTIDANQASIYAQHLRTAFPAQRVKSWIDTAPDLAFIHLLTSYFLGATVIFATFLLGILQYILLQITWQERTTEWQRLHAWGLTKKDIMHLWGTEVAFSVLLGVLIGTFLGWASIAMLIHTGINLASFSEGLGALGYNTKFYPVLFWQDWYFLLSFFMLVPCLNFGYTSYKQLYK